MGVSFRSFRNIRWSHRKLCNLTVRRCVQYFAPQRSVLHLHDRGIFQGVWPPERTEEMRQLMESGRQCVYCGFDPTADSLHVGNLLAIIGLLHCRRAGHNTVALIGGATAQLGDPSGKTRERDPLSPAVVEANVARIQRCLERIFRNHDAHFCRNNGPGADSLPPVTIVDNAEWYSGRNVIEFLASVGRHFRVGQLLSKDSVRSRLESREGISFTEFSYQVFQAFDWLYLYKHHHCRVQLGGNDQIGNIMSGHDLIGKVTEKHVFGLTVPLVTSEAGHKLGKTAGNAVWLSANKTSPFDFYQFFLRMHDTEVEKYLKLFTFICDKDIRAVVLQHKAAPESRRAQRLLAEQVTLLVHGEEGLSSAQRCTDALYGNSIEAIERLKGHELADVFRNATTCSLEYEAGLTLFDLVLKAGCFRFESDARRIISEGGVYVNNVQQTSPDHVILPTQHVLSNNLTLVRIGKKNYFIIKWTNIKL